jgi:hypothetical protein
LLAVVLVPTVVCLAMMAGGMGMSGDGTRQEHLTESFYPMSGFSLELRVGDFPGAWDSTAL